MLFLTLILVGTLCYLAVVVLGIIAAMKGKGSKKFGFAQITFALAGFFILAVRALFVPDPVPRLPKELPAWYEVWGTFSWYVVSPTLIAISVYSGSLLVESGCLPKWVRWLLALAITLAVCMTIGGKIIYESM